MRRHDESIDEALLSSVLFLADRGMSAKAIHAATGLSPHQIYYRTHAFGISLQAYRNGETKLAKELIDKTPCVRFEMKASPGQVYKVANFRTDKNT